MQFKKTVFTSGSITIAHTLQQQKQIVTPTYSSSGGYVYVEPAVYNQTHRLSTPQVYVLFFNWCLCDPTTIKAVSLKRATRKLLKSFFANKSSKLVDTLLQDKNRLWSVIT